MGQFFGSHQNRIDSKGRVSVPAPFRAVLRDGADATIVLRPSHKFRCIEAWPARAFAELAAPLDSLELFSDDHDDLLTTLYADASEVEPDKEGRIVLPDALKQHAALAEAVLFMGAGRMFQIWEPAVAAARKQDVAARGATRRLTIPGRATVQ